MGSSAKNSVGWFTMLSIYFSLGVLFLFGHARNFFERILQSKRSKKGYKSLTGGFEGLFRKGIYNRIHDCFNRPINSSAGPTIQVMERKGMSFRETTGKTREAVNLGSYNYLGFASPGGPTEERVLENVRRFGISTASPLGLAGRTCLHEELEQLVAKFLNVPDAMIFGMGWATNATAIPSIVGKGCLIFSDSLNHNSIVAGCRASGAEILVFKHNDWRDLEFKIQSALAKKQPRTRIPWQKILVIVEGIYSMEGETCALREIVAVCKKYKCYIYVDEAHSIGALGKTGRGICEHTGVDPNDVDILMGTFTKSFGAIGGYVAGKRELIEYMRAHCASQHCSTGLSPACVAQILGVLRLLMGLDHAGLGRKKIKALHDNSNWFRRELKKEGLLVLGAKDSACIPVVIGGIPKMTYISRKCLEAGLAVVVVGFPATPLESARVRFCISASHTREQLKQVLKKFFAITRSAHVQYLPKWTG